MFCGKCGKQIDENIKFCLYCGNPVRAKIMPNPNIVQSAKEPEFKKPEIEPEERQVINEPIPTAPKPVQEPIQKPIQQSEPVQEPASASMPITEPTPAPTAKADIPSSEIRVKGKKQKNKKSILAFVFGGISLLLAAAILLMAFGILSFSIGSGGISVSSQTASTGFGTPEEAIEYFVERIKSGDIDGALAVCAASQMAENFDYEEQAQRINAVMPIVNGAIVPSEYAIYVKYKENAYKSNILMQLSHIIYSLNSQGEYANVMEGKPLMPIEDINFNEIIDFFDPAVLSELKIVEIDEHSLNNDDRNRENQEKNAEILGADGIDFKSVLYELDGDYYAGGFTLIEYDGEWYIDNLYDPLMGMPPYGTLLPIDGESEFSDMLG